MRRVMAAAVIIGLLLAPLYVWQDSPTYPLRSVDPRLYLFDLCGAVLVLLACRGLAPKVFALVVSAPFAVILGVLSVFSSIFLWASGGGR